MTRLSFLLALLVLSASAINVRETEELGKQKPRETPRPGAETSQGCFKSGGALKNKYKPKSGVSSGSCKTLANDNKEIVFAMKADKCFFGTEYPPEEDRVDDEKCNFQCPGYPQEACGGISGGSFYSVFNTGIELDVPYLEPEVSTTSSSTIPTPTETRPDEEEKEEEEKPKDEGGVNIAGIAAGTVIGVLAIAGSIGGVFFYMRRKRNQEIEEEHRRNAAVNSFIGHRPPGSSGSLSVNDARLDPIMAQRRMSDGSIADNEDYSRRILRVTNV